MANVTIPDLTALGANVAAGDLLEIADVSNANASRKVTQQELIAVQSSPTIDSPTLTGTTIAATVNATSANVTNFLPVSNDGAAIGASGTAFSDLFLASGAVINFNAGNYTLTHSAGVLTANLDFRVTTAGTDTASVVTVGGTQTLTGKSIAASQITAGSLGGTITLGEGAQQIALDPALSADGTYSGIVMTGTAGYAQSFGDVVYLDPTDSRWEACDANSAAGADGDCRGTVGMVVVPGTDGTACTILIRGKIRADSKFPTFTINNPIYISETAGAVTQTQPTTTDVVIRILGAALTADEMLFMPDNMWITHT
jgi:hypothetical protein